jgi:hypothetical protein
LTAFLGLDFLIGGAERMRLAACSKLTPFNLKSMALGINYRFTWTHFTTLLSASIAKSQMARPKKVQLPIGLQDMLRIALPNKRPEDRMRIFRAWARSNLTTKLWRVPTEEEFQVEFDLWCKKPFTEMFWVQDVAAFIKNFVPHFTAANRKKRAQTAANAKWKKRKVKNG